MGEEKRRDRSLTFNRSIRIGGCGERLSSSAGLLLLRELDERWQVMRRLCAQLSDVRRGSHVVWSLRSQLRARVFALVAGYGAQRDVCALGRDPVLRLSTSDRRGTTPLEDPRGRRRQPERAHVSSASGAKGFLLELLANFEREVGPVKKVRGDSSFVSGELLEALEARGTGYVFRIATNKKLQRMAAPYLKLPKGRPSATPREWLYSLPYQSRRWPEERRVILVVQETPGELFPHYFFLLTSDRRSKPESILAHYRQRGTSESRFGELKSRLTPKLSCTSKQGDLARQAAWKANASTFLLYLLADGLLHALRWLTKGELSQDGESLPRLHRVQRCLIDVAARVTTSARRVRVYVAASARDIWLWALSRMGRLRPVT